MKNPVDYMVDHTGLTRAEFTAKYDLGKNLLLRLSQGRLQSVTSRISSLLWGEWRVRGLDQDDFMEVYNTLDLDVAYQRWIHNQRIVNKIRLPHTLPKDGGSPFARFVKAIGSVSKTAQVLCVVDVSVQRYADGRIEKMPPSIKQALTDMQYRHVASLEEAQKKWQEQHA
jgi:hypothetical protein